MNNTFGNRLSKFILLSFVVLLFGILCFGFWELAYENVWLKHSIGLRIAGLMCLLCSIEQFRTSLKNRKITRPVENDSKNRVLALVDNFRNEKIKRLKISSIFVPLITLMEYLFYGTIYMAFGYLICAVINSLYIILLRKLQI